MSRPSSLFSAQTRQADLYGLLPFLFLHLLPLLLQLRDPLLSQPSVRMAFIQAELLQASIPLF